MLQRSAIWILLNEYISFHISLVSFRRSLLKYSYLGHTAIPRLFQSYWAKLARVWSIIIWYLSRPANLISLKLFLPNLQSAGLWYFDWILIYLNAVLKTIFSVIRCHACCRRIIYIEHYQNMHTNPVKHSMCTSQAWEFWSYVRLTIHELKLS